MVFSISLIALIFFVVDYYYTDQDTILDAHEMYFYSQLINSWDFPLDSIKIKQDVINLQYNISIYSGDKNLIWSFPSGVDTTGYTIIVDSEYLGLIHNIKIPSYVSFGKNDSDENLTSVKKEGLYYFLTIPQEYNAEYLNYIPPLLLLLFFMFGLNYFIQYNLKPIKLMKKRILSLREGNLTDKIAIISNDELSDLSKAMNKMVEDIKSLLGQKQQLLLDVSHELRSPLARMLLLIEMIPEHKNQKRLIEEIVFLEGMISNLLLSDKLSIPYSNLEYQQIRVDHLIIKTLDVINLGEHIVDINNLIPKEYVLVDETKMIIAIRNVVENALKYSDPLETIALDINKDKNNTTISIKSIGQEIIADEKDNLFKPFFRSKIQKNHASGFGLGLTICKKIIDAHGGVLELKTNGKKTTFNIKIPINKP
jgi:signal transduction histidine kinase